MKPRTKKALRRVAGFIPLTLIFVGFMFLSGRYGGTTDLIGVALAGIFIVIFGAFGLAFLLSELLPGGKVSNDTVPYDEPYDEGYDENLEDEAYEQVDD